MPRIRKLLSDKNFSFLWFSQIISNFGDRLNQMALIGLVYARTPGSTFEMAKLLSFTIIPVFVVGPVAGIFVDRWNKKYTMIVSDLVRAIAVLFIPLFLTYSKGMIPIYVMVFLTFSMTRFFLTSKLSIIPDIVEKDKLLLANSLTSTTMMIATVIGYGFGGLIVARVGASGGFFIDSATFLISGIMLTFVTLRLKDSIKADRKEIKISKLIRKTVLDDIKEGIIYLKGHKDIRMIANTLFLIMSGVGSLYVIVIVFVQETLGSSTEHLGYLAVFLGSGLFLGSIVYGRLGAELCKRTVINMGLAVTGFTIVVFSIVLSIWPSFPAAAVLTAILGIVASPIAISANTLLHEVMKEEMRGRVFSSLEIIMHAAFLIFMVITSVFAEWISKGWLIAIIGIIFACIAVFKLLRSAKIR